MAKSDDDLIVYRIPNILKYVRALIKTSHFDWCDGTYDILYVINMQRERHKKGGTIVWRVCESSDYRTFVCEMRIDVMSYINTPSESMAYCKEDMDSKFGKKHGR